TEARCVILGEPLVERFGRSPTGRRFVRALLDAGIVPGPGGLNQLFTNLARLATGQVLELPLDAVLHLCPECELRERPLWILLHVRSGHFEREVDRIRDLAFAI